MLERNFPYYGFAQLSVSQQKPARRDFSILAYNMNLVLALHLTTLLEISKMGTAVHEPHLCIFISTIVIGGEGGKLAM